MNNYVLPEVPDLNQIHRLSIIVEYTDNMWLAGCPCSIMYYQ